MDEKKENTGEETTSDGNSPELNLFQAKMRFVEAVGDMDPLSGIKNHPFISSSFAFICGFALNRFSKSLLTMPVLPLAMQLGQIAAKAFLNTRK